MRIIPIILSLIIAVCIIIAVNNYSEYKLSDIKNDIEGLLFAEYKPISFNRKITISKPLTPCEKVSKYTSDILNRGTYQSSCFCRLEGKHLYCYDIITKEIKCELNYTNL